MKEPQKQTKFFPEERDDLYQEMGEQTELDWEEDSDEFESNEFA